MFLIRIVYEYSYLLPYLVVVKLSIIDKFIGYQLLIVDNCVGGKILIVNI